MICARLLYALSTPGEAKVQETRKITKALRQRTALMHCELLSCAAYIFLNIQVSSFSKPPTTSHCRPQTTPMFGAAENCWQLSLKMFLPTSFGFAMNRTHFVPEHTPLRHLGITQSVAMCPNSTTRHVIQDPVCSEKNVLLCKLVGRAGPTQKRSASFLMRERCGQD